MEDDDVAVWKQLMEVGRDILSVPRVAAEAEDQQPWTRGRVGRNDMDPVQRLAVGRVEPEGLRARRQRSWPGHGMGREQSVPLEFVEDHGG